jgi:hypothetical protein
MNEYHIGTEVVLRCEFKNPRRGMRVDPTTVSCLVLAPGSTEPTSISTGRISEGIYEAVVLVDRAGDWEYRFSGAGNYRTASEKKFKGKPSRFVPAP